MHGKMGKAEGFLYKMSNVMMKNGWLKCKLNLVCQKGVRIKRDIENRKKYNSDKKIYSQLNKRKNFVVSKQYEYKILSEWRDQAGRLTSYFWQDLWGGMMVAEKMPERHFDIGSRIDGFISHLMVLGVPVTLIDIRPLDQELKNVDFVQADATKLDGIADDSIASLSALCSLEHFGLGRYGDSIDPEACYKAFKAIQRVVKPGGYIYLSLPIGKERLCFNAHRVFDPRTVIKEFTECNLEEYSVVDQDKNPALIRNCDFGKYEKSEAELMGLFCFRKK